MSLMFKKKKGTFLSEKSTEKSVRIGTKYIVLIILFPKFLFPFFSLSPPGSQ